LSRGRPYYFLEQLGFRKIIDSTFMMASMITGDPDPDDITKYFRALRLAQRDIDLRPELYTHYYREEFPPRFHDVMDTTTHCLVAFLGFDGLRFTRLRAQSKLRILFTS
jgi:hypothetical protein